jgi:hypothetical protein
MFVMILKIFSPKNGEKKVHNNVFKKNANFFSEKLEKYSDDNIDPCALTALATAHPDTVMSVDIFEHLFIFQTL